MSLKWLLENFWSFWAEIFRWFKNDPILFFFSPNPSRWWKSDCWSSLHIQPRVWIAWFVRKEFCQSCHAVREHAWKKLHFPSHQNTDCKNYFQVYRRCWSLLAVSLQQEYEIFPSWKLRRFLLEIWNLSTVEYSVWNWETMQTGRLLLKTRIITVEQRWKDNTNANNFAWFERINGTGVEV